MPINTPLQAQVNLPSMADPNQSAALRQRAVEHSVDTTNQVSQQLTNQLQAGAQRSHESAMQSQRIVEERNARNQQAGLATMKMGLDYLNDQQSREFWAQEQDKSRRISAALQEAATFFDDEDFLGGTGDMFRLESSLNNVSNANGLAYFAFMLKNKLAGAERSQYDTLMGPLGMEKGPQGAITWDENKRPNGVPFGPNAPTTQPAAVGGSPQAQAPVAGVSSPRQAQVFSAPQDNTALKAKIDEAFLKMGEHHDQTARDFAGTRVAFTDVPRITAALGGMIYGGGSGFDQAVALIDKADTPTGANRLLASTLRELKTTYGKDKPKDPTGWSKVHPVVAEAALSYLDEVKEGLEATKDSIPAVNYDRVMSTVREMNAIEKNYRESQGQVTGNNLWMSMFMHNRPGARDAFLNNDPDQLMREWFSYNFEKQQRSQGWIDSLPVLKIAQTRRMGIGKLKTMARQYRRLALDSKFDEAESVMQQMEAERDRIVAEVEAMTPAMPSMAR